MSGLDYTKNQGLGNSLTRRVRGVVYTLVFLSRTRFEKWLLYISLTFGLASLVLSAYLIFEIEKPAPIQVSCDMEKVREVLSSAQFIPDESREAQVGKTTAIEVGQAKTIQIAPKSEIKNATSTLKSTATSTKKKTKTKKKVTKTKNP